MAQESVQHRVLIADPPIAQFFLADTRLAWLWLIIRVYAGYQWLTAGLDKFGTPAWTGDQAGTGISGFVTGALTLTGGAHPSVPGWYAAFLQYVVLPYAAIWSWAITLGEIAVGVGLILGVLTGFAAFFGGMMNASYLLAGTVSINPLLFIFATWLVLGWRVAGYYGADYWLLPALGVPGKPGELITHKTSRTTITTTVPAH
jgi:thiosulfate dehydrogenase [quinone] large subunit